MPTGKGIPIKDRFENPIKFNAVIDQSNKLHIDIIAGSLVSKFGYIPTHGQVVDYLLRNYEKSFYED